MAEGTLSLGESVTAGTSPDTTIDAAPGSGSGQSSATAASGWGEPPKRPYPASAEQPTQEGPQGLRFDFNDGCRVAVAEGKQPWKKAGRVNSTKRYYVRFRVEVSAGGKSLLAHDYDAKDREVLIQFPVGTIGDTMGWFPYAARFREQHGCKLTCAMAERLIPLFRDAYPEIGFISHEEVDPKRYYATYSIGLFFDDKDCVHQPCDFRHVGLHRTAGYILGVDPTEAPPRLDLPDEGRPIAEPYVCIAAQSTTQSKYWNNPHGWREIVQFLKDAGYRVVCIDQKPVHGTGLVWNHLPLRRRGRDRAGALAASRRVLCRPVERPLLARLGRRHAGGDDQRLHPPDQRVFDTLPGHQLPRLQRLLERPAPPLRPQRFPVVPAHAGTPLQFECTRLITAEQVKQTIRRIPAFAAFDRKMSAIPQAAE